MFDCLLLMAGSGTRTSLTYNKVEYKINDKPLYQYSLDKFLSIKECNNIILVVKEEEYNKYKTDGENEVHRREYCACYHACGQEKMQ